MKLKRPGITFAAKTAAIPSEAELFYKQNKAYYNTLKCPVCGGQLDGNAQSDNFVLNCVYDKNEYLVHFNVINNIPVIINEEVRMNHNKHRFVIEQAEFTKISTYNVDSEGWVIGILPARKALEFQGKLFNFQAINKEKLIKRLKIILVFQ